jgi:sec-independent protein translocase protein TatA
MSVRAGCHLGKGKELFMGRIGMPELLIIMVIVVMIFGANRIPEIFRGVGKGIKNFKDASRDDDDHKDA